MEPVYSDEETDDLKSKASNPMSRPANEFQLIKFKELITLYKEKLNEIQKIKSEEPCHPRAMATEYQGFEKAIGILEMVNTSNSDLNKVYTVFTYLISEIRLAREYIDTNVIPALNFYGEGTPQDQELEEGDAELMIGKIVGFLGETFENLSYLNSLVINMVHQLHCLFNKKQAKSHDMYTKLFKYVHPMCAFDALGMLLGALASIDAVVADNENLTNHWELYKRMMQFVKTTPTKYGINERQEKQLRKCCLQLDRTILGASCLQVCLTQKAFEPGISSNKELQAEFQQYFRIKLDKIYNTIDTQFEWQESKQVVDVLCLYFLYRRLYPKDFDKKLFKAFWGLQKKAPAVSITGLVLIYPSELLMKHSPPPKSITLEPKDPDAYISQFIQKSDEQLSNYVQFWHTKFSIWSSRMQSFLNTSSSISGSQEQLQSSQGKLLLQGLILAYQIQNYVQTNTALHEHHGVPFSANFIPLIMEAIELIKAISSTLERKQEIIALNLGGIMKLIIDEGIRPFDTIREKNYGKKGETATDLMNVYRLVQDLAKGCMNATRIDILRFSNEILDMKSELRENDRSVVNDCIWRLGILADYQDNLKRSTDCSFVYWIQQLNTHFLSFIYAEPANVHRLKYLYMALEDSAYQLLASKHMEDPKSLKDNYLKDREDELVNQVIMPLARAIESDLRLQIHSLYISGIEKQNPLESSNLSWFLESQPLQFCEKIIDIKKRIEGYLDETFYNMTALNLNDWRVYEEMRSLAKQKYNMVLSEVHLPSKHLDQGMDLLEITRKLPSFVSGFKYNLHNQFFMEATTGDDKHVRCVSFMHITNSLRTHGLGLINSTINTTYKLLAKKFQVFSQFLFDDHIFSQLVKDKKFFEANRGQLNQMMPYDRPETFLKEIKRLGTFEGGATYIDKFRQLITQIGNTLGLIRMIKTAGLNLTATKTQFIPNTQEIPEFTELAKEYSPSTDIATKVLDNIIGSLTKNFTEDTEYFSILVKTFQGVLNNSEAKHLKYFYLIIPAVTISFIENILVAKDKLTKKKADDMYFTDDGFAVGLAYILRILEQENDFDSLHWFESVEQRFEQEEERLNNIKNQEEVMKMQQISLRKIIVFRQEFELLKYCFLGARILFFSQA